MTFENNHIQLPIENDIYNNTLHRYIMKRIEEIDNDKEALPYITTKLVLKAAAILYNNNNQLYIPTKPHNLTHINITIKTTHQNKTKQQPEKKPPTLILRVIERILNFYRR